LIKKDLDIKFLTAKLVKEAYPDINLEDWLWKLQLLLQQLVVST
jgi:hypothetical protein